MDPLADDPGGGGRELRTGTMSITKEKKGQLIGQYKRGESDTGSPEVQIALLTARINELLLGLK